MAIEITDSNFEELVLNSKIPVVLDFWAGWLGKSRLDGAIINELYEKYEDKILIGKVNTDGNPKISLKFNIKTVPVILIIKDEEIFGKLIGEVFKEQLFSELESILN